MNEGLAKAVALLYGAYHKADDVAGQKVYALMLKDVPADILNEAINYCVNNIKWLPSVAEVKEKARDIWNHKMYLAKEEAWKEVMEFASGGVLPKSETAKKIIRVCGADFLKDNKDDVDFLRGYYSLYSKEADIGLLIKNISRSLGVK